jgi:hypothetical protein
VEPPSDRGPDVAGAAFGDPGRGSEVAGDQDGDDRGVAARCRGCSAQWLDQERNFAGADQPFGLYQQHHLLSIEGTEPYDHVDATIACGPSRVRHGVECPGRWQPLAHHVS